MTNENLDIRINLNIGRLWFSVLWLDKIFTVRERVTYRNVFKAKFI